MSASNADLAQDDSPDAAGSPEERAVEPNSVITECDLPDEPEKVWRALTVPKLLAEWLPEAVQSEILEAQPNRLLRYRWTGGGRDKDAVGRPLESVVTFELTGTEGGGTHLRVVHRPILEETVSAVAQTATAVAGTVTVMDQISTVPNGRVVCLLPRMRSARKPPVAMACVQTSLRRAA